MQSFSCSYYKKYEEQSECADKNSYFCRRMSDHMTVYFLYTYVVIKNKHLDEEELICMEQF